jgi:hypothetical protein
LLQHNKHSISQIFIMSKKRTYNDALSALTDVLSETEKELEAREEKLRKAEESFEVDRNAVYGDTSPSDVLHLNIGGTKTTVLRRTLTSIADSMLARKFSGRWDDSIDKDKDDNFFIDQEFSLFQPMLKYLRNKANGIDKYNMDSPAHGSVGDGNSAKDFYRMVDYYGMTNGIYPTNLNIHTGSEDSVEIIGPMKVSAKEWTTFQICQEGHSRLIKSYEVTLGTVQRIQIGWKCTNGSVSFDEGNSSGVGDVQNTNAIDLTRSTYLCNGNGTPIDALEHAKGTVVRSENYGCDWYVKGELLEIPKEGWNALNIDVKDIRGGFPYRAHVRPFISIKGEMEITSIVLED